LNLLRFFRSLLALFGKVQYAYIKRKGRSFVLEHGAQQLLEQLQNNPVIAAVGNEEELLLALDSDCRVVFMLMGNLLDIGSLTHRVHESGKLCVIHLDLIEGFSSKEIAVDALQRLTGAEGIISTRGALIRRAKQLGLAAVQRGFMLDSRSLASFEQQISQSNPDFVEILPGLLPKVIASLKERIHVPIIAGGFIHEKEDVIAALQAGALAVSASSPNIWSM
jgi:glycerol uptake operon antiterminator